MIALAAVTTACDRPQPVATAWEMPAPAPPDPPAAGQVAAAVALPCRFAPPLPAPLISSRFGSRDGRAHRGVDFAAPRDTPVNAASSGTIVFSGWKNGYGRTVDIRHADGDVTRYAHLAGVEDDLREGAAIEAGQRIGAVGTSGRVSGPNLHFEVLVAGTAVDPVPLLPASG